MELREKGNLPRLEKQFYQAHAVVFWTNLWKTVQGAG